MLKPGVIQTLSRRFLADVWVDWHVPSQEKTISQLLPQGPIMTDLVEIANELEIAISSQKALVELTAYINRLINGLNANELLTYLAELSAVSAEDLVDKEVLAALAVAIQANLLRHLKPYSSYTYF